MTILTTFDLTNKEVQLSRCFHQTSTRKSSDNTCILLLAHFLATALFKVRVIHCITVCATCEVSYSFCMNCQFGLNPMGFGMAQRWRPGMASFRQLSGSDFLWPLPVFRLHWSAVEELDPIRNGHQGSCGCDKQFRAQAQEILQVQSGTLSENADAFTCFDKAITKWSNGDDLLPFRCEKMSWKHAKDTCQTPFHLSLGHFAGPVGGGPDWSGGNVMRCPWTRTAALSQWSRRSPLLFVQIKFCSRISHINWMWIWLTPMF